jgi:2-polyprenyl-3-methyl-5-hydroxy-6-metoxy-1,4-benzoquinol methylase
VPHPADPAGASAGVAERAETGQVVVLAACPLCGSADAAPHAVYPELTWVRCGCGLIYKRAAAPSLLSGAIYDPGYFRAGDRKHSHSYDRRTGHRVRKSRRQILDALNHTAPGAVLDVGCSLGYTLRAARDLGLGCAGMDIAPFAVEACRRQGFRAALGSVEAVPYRSREFAVVVMKHVLEHTPRPREALVEVARVLRPGGALFVAVPHAAYHKAVRNPRASRFFRPDTPGGTEHFVYFTPATLSRMLEECRFRTARVHPHLLHRRGGTASRLLDLVLALPRAAWGALLSGFSLRKEFWLVAVRL